MFSKVYCVLLIAWIILDRNIHQITWRIIEWNILKAGQLMREHGVYCYISNVKNVQICNSKNLDLDFKWWCCQVNSLNLIVLLAHPISTSIVFDSIAQIWDSRQSRRKEKSVLGSWAISSQSCNDILVTSPEEFTSFPNRHLCSANSIIV